MQVHGSDHYMEIAISASAKKLKACNKNFDLN